MRPKPSVLLAGMALCAVSLIIVPHIVAGRVSVLGGVSLLLLMQLALYSIALLVNDILQGSPNPSFQPLTRDPLQLDVPIDEIWRSHDGRAKQPRRRIALAAPDGAEGRAVASDLAGLGHEVHHCNVLDAVLDAVAARPGHWDLIIVDLDLAMDVEEVVDALLMFRRSCPKVSVLLLSGAVRRNDLSGERAAIGDATLRKPAYRRQLAEGMATAWANFDHRRANCD